MNHKDRPWRKVHRTVLTREERSTETSRSYNWNTTDVHTLRLECGHVQIRRGYRNPPKRVICKDCEAGKKPEPVTGPPGYFDKTSKQPRDPVARALLRNEREKARQKRA